MKIRGTVVFEPLEGGFWGIVDQSGQHWLPVNMPEQLKVRGAEVEVTALESDAMSIFNWGTPVEIRAFHTLPRF